MSKRNRNDEILLIGIIILWLIGGFVIGLTHWREERDAARLDSGPELRGTVK